MRKISCVLLLSILFLLFFTAVGAIPKKDTNPTSVLPDPSTSIIIRPQAIDCSESSHEVVGHFFLGWGEGIYQGDQSFIWVATIEIKSGSTHLYLSLDLTALEKLQIAQITTPIVPWEIREPDEPVENLTIVLPAIFFCEFEGETMTKCDYPFLGLEIATQLNALTFFESVLVQEFTEAR